MKNNHSYWHWYPNSYPTNKGIHFSFTTMNFALRFMRKFKTMPFEISVKYTYDKNYVAVSQGKMYYSIKMLNQNNPTDKQYTWLRRCKIDIKETPMTFEEFKRGYRIYEGPKPEKLKHEPVWYIQSLDYRSGHGYYAYAADKSAAVWTLEQTFDARRNRGDL